MGCETHGLTCVAVSKLATYPSWVPLFQDELCHGVGSDVQPRATGVIANDSHVRGVRRPAGEPGHEVTVNSSTSCRTCTGTVSPIERRIGHPEWEWKTVYATALPPRIR